MMCFDSKIPDPLLIQEVTVNCLEEDVWDVDHTSLACIPEDQQSCAELLVKEDNTILAGVAFATEAFNCIDETLTVEVLIEDGTLCNSRDVALRVTGNTQSILKSERIVLNVMQRMTGIATQTKYFANLAASKGIKILDTRKTAPGLRALDKWAVHIGGGVNHRMGLSDAIMIKDNHVDSVGSITKAISKVKEYLAVNQLSLPVIVETRNLLEVAEVLVAEPIDRILLDNFTPDNIKKAITTINSACEIEVSGGVNSNTIQDYLIEGIDFISMGSITHSVISADLSLKVVRIV